MPKMKHHLLFFPILLLATLSPTSAQSPAQAPSPGPSGPPNITAVLTKAGQFSTFIRLLRSTQEDQQIDQQLNNSKQGLTIFAPTDSAFSALPAGTLNSLDDEGKSELIQFHVIPDSLSPSEFQTASNPIRTQAGDTGPGDFPLNVTTSGNTVNITTGLVNTTVSSPAYTNGQLYVYSVDQVLLPWKLFGAPVPSAAPAPAPPRTKKSKKAAGDADVDTTGVASRGLTLVDLNKVSGGVSVIVALFFMVVL